jgi:hypothetical protein
VLPVLDGYLGEETDDAGVRAARALVAEQSLIFYKAVANHAGGTFDCHEGVRQLLEDLDEVRELTLYRASRDMNGEILEFTREPLGSAAGRAFLFLYRFFQRMGAAEGTGETTAALFNRFGLKQVVAEVLGGVEWTAGELLPRGEGREGLLMGILMNHAGYFTAWDDAECHQRTRALFNDHEVQAFLLVHESGGDTWFNKERFECLLQWLFLAQMSGDLAGRDELEHLFVRMSLLHKAVELLNEAAEKARYRPQQFQALLNGEATSAVPR